MLKNSKLFKIKKKAFGVSLIGLPKFQLMLGTLKSLSRGISIYWLINWLIGWCLTPYRQYIVQPCNGGLYIGPHRLWHKASVFAVSNTGPPQILVTLYDMKGLWAPILWRIRTDHDHYRYKLWYHLCTCIYISTPPNRSLLTKIIYIYMYILLLSYFFFTRSKIKSFNNMPD